MKTPKAITAKPLTLLQTVRQKEGDVARDMDALAKQYGAEVFRIAGQRYFARQRAEAVIREEIASREAELANLKRKAAR